MGPGDTSRRIVWASMSPVTKMSLVLNDLDDHDTQLEVLYKEARETRTLVRRKLNIIMTVATGLLVALSGNLIILLLTR